MQIARSVAITLFVVCFIWFISSSTWYEGVPPFLPTAGVMFFCQLSAGLFVRDKNTQQVIVGYAFMLFAILFAITSFWDYIH